MSAFVIDEATMHRCVAAICYKNRYGQIIRQFHGIDTSAKDAPTRIGRLLFTMNIEAVYQRYPDTQDAPENMPGPIGDDGRSTALQMAANYRYHCVLTSLSPAYGISAARAMCRKAICSRR